MPKGNRWRAFGLLGVLLLVAACAHHHQISDDPNAGADDPANVLPARYKPDILGAMHAYLNDPTGIRDAGIAEPALKSVGNSRRYVVCLRLNAKQNGHALCRGPGDRGGVPWPAGSITSSIRPRTRAPAQPMCRFRSWKSFRARA